MQFNLLTSLGLRDHHTLLDIGCGSLRLGRLAVPYLRPGRYFGLEPNAWLIAEGIARECGRDLIVIKQPRFEHFTDFRLTAFGRRFDYLIAQSIFTHAAPAQIRHCLAEAQRSMHANSVFVANIMAGDTNYEGNTWVYPGCVTYTDTKMQELADAEGLVCEGLDFPTVNGTRWHSYRLPGGASGAIAASAGHNYPHIFGKQLSAAEVAADGHSELVGGLWDEIGRLQFDFLKSQGLTPSHRLLDVGCGAFRGGVHFIRYLAIGNYFGIDLNASLVEAGRDVELAKAGLTYKKPHLLVNDAFEVAAFGTTFDYALAHSVFTHLPFNSIERCLANVARVLKPGARFYATYFESPSPHSMEPLRHPGGIITRSDADPFHYHFKTFRFLSETLPLTVRNIGDWNHPRGQHMLEFVRRD
jgi:SAM-dependent methyltransferase